MNLREHDEAQTPLLYSDVTEHIVALLLGNARHHNGDRLTLSPEQAESAAAETARRLHESALDFDRYPYQAETYGVRFYFELDGEGYPGPGRLTAWLWDEDQWRPIGALEVRR